MLEITVKTLDGRNHKFTVADDTTVRQFKEEIASSIEINADVQRLIYQGRVLADEKKINDYDVNGKTVHVVQRLPPSSRNQSSAAGVGASPARGQQRDDRGASRGETNSFVLGSFTLPADAADPNQVQNIVQQMLSGMGDLGRAHITTQNSGNGSVDVHINVTPNPQQSDAQNRLNVISRMMTSVRQTLGRLQSVAEGSDGRDVPMETSASDSQENVTNSSQSTTVGGSSSRSSSSTSQQSSSQTASTTQDPAVSDLAGVLADVLKLNEDFAPHLSRYHQLMTSDPDLRGNATELQRSQRLCDLTAETFHHLSHIYHSLSDLAVDMNQPPPRRMIATASVAPQATAVIQQTIPVQAQISVAHVPVGPMPVPPSAGGATPTEAETAPHGTTPQAPAGSAAASNPPANSSQPGDTTTSQTPRSAPPPSGGFPGRMPSPWEMGMPRIRFGMPFPRPPGAFPPGFHMVVEMSQDGTTAGGGGGGATQPENPQTPSSQPPGTGGAGMPFAEGGFQFPPGDFLQNIIQMAGAALRGQQGQQGNTQPITVGPSAINRQSEGAPTTAGGAHSAGASTTTTSSAPTLNGAGGGGGGNGNQGQGGNPPRAGVFAGPRLSGVSMPPGGLHFPVPPMGGPLPGIFVDPFGLIPNVDPYLPCNSRHFIPRRNNQPNQNASAAQPHLAHHFVSNLVSSIITPPGAGPAGAAQPAREDGQPAPPPLARLVVVPSMMAGAVAGAAQAFADSQQPMMGAGGSASPQGQSAAGGAPPVDTGISRLIQGITTQLTHAAFGQQAGLTIADFLNSLGNEFSVSQGEGFLTDIFNCITQHLVFSDLMMIFFGQVAPLENLRVPLQNFVSTRLLNGRDATDSNIEEAVNRLMLSMQSDIEETATACATDNGQFGRSLYDRCRSVIHEFLNLSRFCLVGGSSALDRLIQNRLQAIDSGVNPTMQAAMVQMARQQLQQILPSISMRDEDIQHYVVLRQAQQTAPGGRRLESSPQSTDSYETASGGVDNAEEAPIDAKLGGKSEPVSMETESSVPDRFSGREPFGGPGVARISAELLARLPPPPSHDDEDEVQVVIGSEEWHAEVPPEWVPVITRDVARQRRQAPQPSFSDAYLTGMPSKRRKMMNRERQREDFADVRVALPETIRRAAQQIDAQPQTSFAELSNDVTANSQLHSAFQQEISEAIRRRLASDPDFNPSRFPNASKFFDSKK